jgi:hypothetical protein
MTNAQFYHVIVYLGILLVALWVVYIVILLWFAKKDRP